MNLPVWWPFGDTRTYFVPWIRFRTPEGEWAEGPMIRQGRGRREILAWLEEGEALGAAKDLVSQTGGTHEVRSLDRKALTEACRLYTSWGSRVVAVVVKPAP